MGALFYFLACFIVALFGRNRILRFWGTFLVAALVTPVVAAIILLVATPVARPKRRVAH